MLTQLITETLLGALTGYITNDTAIRSLFKPNGVIEQTRDDFAHEAGALLERQVLTPAVLAHQLQLPQVQEALRDALHTFLQQALPHAVQNMTLNDLPDMDTAVQYITEELHRFAVSERDTIVHDLNKYFAWDTLCTPEQSTMLANTLERILLDTMAETQFAQSVWQSWSSAKGNMSMKELGLDALCDTVIQNLAQESNKWVQTLTREYGAQLYTAAQESVHQLHLEAVLLELDKQMSTMTLGQYLNCDAEQLSAALTQLLHSEQGKQLIDAVVAEILKALETVTLPIQQLIPAELVDDTAPILQEELPVILTQVLDWVWDNKQSVQRMLEEAVDEIAMETGGMKGALLESLKDSLLGELMQSSDTYAMLLDVLSGDNTTDQTVDYMMHKLTSLLQDNTVGQLIAMLNANGSLQMAVRQFVYENIERYLVRSGSETVQQLMDWCPGAMNLVQHKDEVEALLVRVLLLAADRMDLPAMITKHSHTIANISLTQLLAMDEDAVVHLAQRLVQKASAYAQNALPQIPSNTVYSTLYDTALWWLDAHGTQAITQVGGKLSLPELVHTVANAVDGYTPQLIGTLSQVGLKLMQGRLSILAEEQIQSLSSEEMLELVQDFMGRELQPLNYLGAGMGAAAGATVGMALSTAIPAVSLSAPLLAGGVLAGKAAVFGAVGYTTNCAAVKGLFWPYEPVAGIRTIQGVITKQKERFAGSMGRLVDSYVINDVILAVQIEKLKQYLHENHTAHALAANAQLFERLSAELAMERRRFTEPACKAVTDYGTHKSKDTLHLLGTKPLTVLTGIVPDDEAEWNALYDTLLPKLEAWLTAQMHKDIPLDTLISVDSLWQWLEHAVPQIALPDLSAMAQELLTSTRTLASIAGDDYTQGRDAIQNAMANYLAAQKTQAQLSHAITQLTNGEQLHHWICHNSSTWIADNLTMLFHWIESVILELLHKRQDAITAAIEQEILNRMGLMTRMGYAMMNGSEIVVAIVDRLLHQKLPIFLSVKRKELEQILYNVWEERLAPHVYELSAKYLTQDTAVLAHNAMRTLLAEPALQRGVVQVAMHALDTAAHVPMASWGSYINAANILAKPQMQLGFQWQTHSKELLDTWRVPLCAFAADVLHSTTIAQLCRGYQDTLLLGALTNDEGIQRVLYGYIHSVINAVSNTTISDWCRWDAVAEGLYRDINALLSDVSFQDWLQYEADLLVMALAEEPDKLLPIGARGVLIERIIQAVFDTAEQHGTAILSQMQLASLAEEQLKLMDSAHLEQVVRGFAQHYLTHIQNRGWLGALFALPGMLLYLL